MSCLTNNLFDRQINARPSHRPPDHSLDVAFGKLSLCRQYMFSDLNDVGAPPLALALNDRLLSVANDGGDVALVHKQDLSLRHKWTAHNNAIFDIKWRKDFDHHLGTASGDKSIIIWDINTATKHYSYDCAHSGSIKSIDFKDHNVLASGSRDGLIKIWDLRCGRGGSVIVIESAHLSQLPSIKSSPRMRQQKTSPLNSVTCVAFNAATDHLYSSGANDGTIKLWDLRKCRRSKAIKSSATPLRELYQTSRRGSPSHGFTCLTFDSKHRLFASCSDHTIYGYLGDDSLPSVKCVGLQANNFTRINTFDDNYIISGSVNGRALIWSVDWKGCEAMKSKTIYPIYLLPHSDEEVTAIAADTHSYSIYTCSDDQNINKWSLFNPNRELESKTTSEPFVQPFNESMTTEEEHKPNVLTPSSVSNGQTSCSLTNWLERSSGKQYTTPSNPNPKRMRLSQSTPTTRPSNTKENKSFRSQRKLFNTNRKISDYFTP